MSELAAKQVEWLQDWRHSGASVVLQREYVKTELARIAAAGAPILTQVLQAPLPIQTELAISILSSDTPLEHEHQQFFLRLVPGAKPKQVDADGNPLKKEDIGNLVTRIGNKGGQLRDNEDELEQAP